MSGTFGPQGILGARETKYVLNLLGIESPEALRKQLDDEERAAAIAKAEEEERAAQEAIRAEGAAKVKEINDALSSGRLIVCINGRTFCLMTVPDFHEIVCECGKHPAWMQETLQCAIQRVSYVNGSRLPVWSRADHHCDSLPAGQGDGLLVWPLSMVYTGKVTCKECGKELDISISCRASMDGELITGPGGQ